MYGMTIGACQHFFGRPVSSCLADGVGCLAYCINHCIPLMVYNIQLIICFVVDTPINRPCLSMPIRSIPVFSGGKPAYGAPLVRRLSRKQSLLLYYCTAPLSQHTSLILMFMLILMILLLILTILSFDADVDGVDNIDVDINYIDVNMDYIDFDIDVDTDGMAAVSA